MEYRNREPPLLIQSIQHKWCIPSYGTDRDLVGMVLRTHGCSARCCWFSRDDYDVRHEVENQREEANVDRERPSLPMHPKILLGMCAPLEEKLLERVKTAKKHI